MISCLILGDSLGVGVHTFMKECTSFTQRGITSSDWVQKFSKLDLNKPLVIISLGSNDVGHNPAIDTIKNLSELREKIPKTSRVIWILPANRQNHDILQLCLKFNDAYINVGKTTDGVHPNGKGYQAIVSSIKALPGVNNEK